MGPPPEVARLLERLHAEPNIEAATLVGSRADAHADSALRLGLSDRGRRLGAGRRAAFGRGVRAAARVLLGPAVRLRRADGDPRGTGQGRPHHVRAEPGPPLRTQHPARRPAAIDAHFWDWTLWLGSKVLAGRHEFVASELQKMHVALLGPVGIEAVPRSLAEAVALFRPWPRSHGRASQLGIEVERALRAHGLV